MSETELKPMMGDTIVVELRSGEEFTGIFQIHPLADECVMNQNGMPMNYKKILRIL